HEELPVVLMRDDIKMRILRRAHDGERSMVRNGDPQRMRAIAGESGGCATDDGSAEQPGAFPVTEPDVHRYEGAEAIGRTGPRSRCAPHTPVSVRDYNDADNTSIKYRRAEEEATVASMLAASDAGRCPSVGRSVRMTRPTMRDSTNHMSESGTLLRFVAVKV